MMKRRLTHHRSHLRDNRWRRTLPEANILFGSFWDCPQSAASRFLNTEFEVLGVISNLEFRAATIRTVAPHKE